MGKGRYTSGGLSHIQTPVSANTGARKIRDKGVDVVLSNLHNHKLFVPLGRKDMLLVF